MKKLILFFYALCLTLLCGTFRNLEPPSDSDPAEFLSRKLIITMVEGSKFPATGDSFADIDYCDDCFVIVDYKGPETKLTEYIERLNADPAVLSVEFDSTLELASDDYFSDSQYWLDNNGTFTKHSGSGSATIHSISDIDIDAPEGWAAYKGMTPVRSAVVAIIDTGVDCSHPDLAEAMWTNTKEIPDNGIDDDGNGYIDDIYGWDFYNGDSSICHYEYSEQHMAELASPYDNDNHGTHCAGIIGAVADNKIGIAGVASAGDVKLMSLKIHGGSDRSGSVSDAIKAIRYADMMGADVCNISWGSYTYSGSLYTAIQRSKMLFVCAAGNDGSDNDRFPLYPACFELDNVISVTFTDCNGLLCYNANYGTASVDAAVPANDIFSTVVGTYGLMSGSSMAAPQVTGIAALLFTLKEGMYAANVRDILLESIKPVPSCDTLMTVPGIFSLNLAMQNAEKIICDSDVPVMSVRLEYGGQDLTLHFEPSDNTSGINNLRYFTGVRSPEYFKCGTAGTAVSENRLVLSKGGTYTFYVNDYAGNSLSKTLRIQDDIVAPVITGSSVSVSNKRKRITITATVLDSQSGLRSVKYLKGCHSAADFRSSSVEALEPDENGKIKLVVNEQGTYTIYASDNRGNTTVRYIMAYIRPATDIRLKKTKKTLNVGSEWSVGAKLTPELSTDKITYKSSDESIATVSSKGKVTAIAPGSCVITATASSGKTAECQLKVKAPSEDE